MSKADAEARFTADVAEHAVQVLRDDGVYRHIMCRKPQRSAYWFEIVTWPGVLTIHGDMGTFTFRRIDDMFEFFRGKSINPGYWAEKLQAGTNCPRLDIAMEFSFERWAECVRNYRDVDMPNSAWNRALEELIEQAEGQDEHTVLQSSYDFEHEDRRLDDFFEHTFREYTFHFLWCCHAITWATSAYDAQKAVAA